MTKQEGKAFEANDWLHSKSPSQKVKRKERRKGKERREDGRVKGEGAGRTAEPKFSSNLTNRTTLSDWLLSEWRRRGFASQITQSLYEVHPWGKNVTLDEVGTISKEKLAKSSVASIPSDWGLSVRHQKRGRFKRKHEGKDTWKSLLLGQIHFSPRWQWAKWATLLA